MIVRALKRLYHLWRVRRDPIAYARSLGVRLGDGCRLLGIQPWTFGSEPYLVTLGRHVEITSGVRFITHDGGVWVFREEHPDIDVIAPIVVGDNVFIGINAIIMPGVTIGSNCVIGAGAVVTGDIPDGHVAAGVPARALKTIEDYWHGVQAKVLPVHQLPPAEKRARLEARLVCGEMTAKDTAASHEAAPALRP